MSVAREAVTLQRILTAKARPGGRLEIAPAESIKKPETQVEWLAWDLEEIDRAIEAHQEVFRALAGSDDVDRRRRLIVVADLFYRIRSLVQGMYVVVHEGLRTSSQVLARALYEAIGSLGYLVNHPHFQREALTWLAFSSLRLIEHFPGQQDLVEEHEELLRHMNTAAVAEARRRMKRKPYSWSGKGFKKMSAESDLKGYEVYSMLSDDVHSGIVGEHLRVLAGDEPGMVSLHVGDSLPTSTQEVSANFARRALHDSFKIFWGQLGGPPVEIRTEDPRAWSPLPKGK